MTDTTPAGAAAKIVMEGMTMGPAMYLAAQFGRRAEINGYARELRRAGLRIVSTWHSDPADTTPEDELTHAQRAALARRDRDELERAGLVVAYGDPPGGYAGSGGRHCEVGYALALGTPVLVVGFRSAVYEYLDEVRFVETPDAAHLYLNGLTLNSRGRVRDAA